MSFSHSFNMGFNIQPQISQINFTRETKVGRAQAQRKKYHRVQNSNIIHLQVSQFLFYIFVSHLLIDFMLANKTPRKKVQTKTNKLGENGLASIKYFITNFQYALQQRHILCGENNVSDKNSIFLFCFETEIKNENVLGECAGTYTLQIGKLFLQVDSQKLKSNDAFVLFLECFDTIEGKLIKFHELICHKKY